MLMSIALYSLKLINGIVLKIFDVKLFMSLVDIPSCAKGNILF
jgi:hypothetical protein